MVSDGNREPPGQPTRGRYLIVVLQVPGGGLIDFRGLDFLKAGMLGSVPFPAATSQLPDPRSQGQARGSLPGLTARDH